MITRSRARKKPIAPNGRFSQPAAVPTEPTKPTGGKPQLRRIK